MAKKFDIKKYLRENSGVRQERGFSLSALSGESYKTRGVFDEENKMAEFSLSSELPYLRSFGWEVLGHNPEEIDMSRLKNGSNLFLNHDTRGVCLGVIESVEIKDKRIIEVVRFSDNPEPLLVYNDVKKGIRGKISVGYEVVDMVDTGELKEGYPVYRVTKWVPFESSIVGVAADDSIGIGRSLEVKEIEAEVAVIEPLETVEVNAVEAIEEKEIEAVVKQTEILIIKEVKKMSETLDKNQIANMLEVGKKFKKQDLAAEFIRAGKSESELSHAILDLFNADNQAFVANGQKAATEVGMTKSEQKTWSFQGVLDAMDGKRNFEREMSDEVARKLGRSQKGEKSIFIPLEMQRSKQSRAMSTTVGAGGYLIETDLMSESLVDVLRNETVSGQLGCTRLTGLRDTINIPRVTTATSGTWVAESTAAAEGSVTLDLITMSPKTATANTLISRKIKQQSSIDVMNFVPRELVQSLGVTVDAAFFNGLGTGNQPTGIRVQSGINTITTATDGSAPTWAFMVQMETEIANDNAFAKNYAYVFNSKTIGKLKSVEKATNTGIFLYDGSMMNGAPVYRTNQLPSNITKGSSGATLSTGLYGAWSNAIIGEWGVLEIMIDPYYLSTAGSIRITGFYDYDVAVKHPESFCEMGSIITV